MVVVFSKEKVQVSKAVVTTVEISVACALPFSLKSNHWLFSSVCSCVWTIQRYVPPNSTGTVFFLYRLSTHTLNYLRHQ